MLDFVTDVSIKKGSSDGNLNFLTIYLSNVNSHNHISFRN